MNLKQNLKLQNLLKIIWNHIKMVRTPRRRDTGKGWHNESKRHDLARQGISTSVKDNAEARMKLNDSKPIKEKNKIKKSEWELQSRQAVLSFPNGKRILKEVDGWSKTKQNTFFKLFDQKGMGTTTAYEMTKSTDKSPYVYQDSNQEKIIHTPTWKKGNVYRFVLEGTGDIFRELTKPKPHYTYIHEKIIRIENRIQEEETWVHPEDSYDYSKDNNKTKFKLMKTQWTNQPTINKI